MQRPKWILLFIYPLLIVLQIYAELQKEYRSIVDSLQYWSILTRPDMSNALSIHHSNQDINVLPATYSALHFLQDTVQLGITYKEDPIQLSPLFP